MQEAPRSPRRGCVGEALRADAHVSCSAGADTHHFFPSGKNYPRRTHAEPTKLADCGAGFVVLARE